MKNLFRSTFVLALFAGLCSIAAIAQKPTLVRNQDEAGRNVYQQTILFNQDATLCINDFFCEINFNAVPAGFRLVVTHVSARYSLVPNSFSTYMTIGQNGDLFGNQAILPAQSIGGTDVVGSGLVQFYVEPGNQPTLFLCGTKVNRAGNYTGQATVVGYLVAIP